MKEETIELMKEETIEDYFLKDLPKWVALLPEDWEVKIEPIYIKIRISNKLITDEESDVKEKVKEKFKEALMSIRKIKNTEVLRIIYFLRMSIDVVNDDRNSFFYFWIKIATD